MSPPVFDMLSSSPVPDLADSAHLGGIPEHANGGTRTSSDPRAHTDPHRRVAARSGGLPRLDEEDTAGTTGPAPIPTITVTPPLEDLPTVVVTPPTGDIPEPEPEPQPEPEPEENTLVPPPPREDLPTVTPPVGEPARLTDSVATFGTRRNGAQDLVNVTPVPQYVVEWLQEQVIRLAEDDGRGPNPAFDAAVRRVLTARLLTAEWPRLFTASGLPLNVTRHGQRYPVSLRLGLTVLGPSPQQLDPMPDGPPVGVQRWGFGINEEGDTAGSGDLRAMNGAFSHSWSVGRGVLRRITFAPKLNLTYNQLTTTATVGKTVQPMVMIQSKGSSWPYDYAMTWELRRNSGSTLAVLSGEGQPGWRNAGATPPRPDDPAAPTPLTVWFPSYLATSQPRASTGLESPDPGPAPVDRLLDELPLFGPSSLVDHDALFTDVLAAFPDQLGSLSEGSLDELHEFLKEGNERSNLPQAWGGSVASPTLYSRSGTVLGYLRFSVSLSGGTELTGPTTASSVLRTYVLRSLRMQGSAQIANALGVTLPVEFSLSPGEADPATGTERRGGSVSFQAGAQHQFAHTLVSAGSARIAHSLRTAEPLLHVTPDMTVSVTLVRADSLPLSPAAGSPLATGKRYPVRMLVPSLTTLGRKPTEARYLPPEVLHLKQLGVSTTPLRVSGTEPLFDQAERWLRDNGFLPSDRPRPGIWDKVTEQATRMQRLENLVKLDQARSRLGLRSALDEMIEGGDLNVFELPTPHGTRRVTVRLTAERRYPGPGDDDGITHDRALPDVQTMNYAGSTIAGDEQFQSTPFAWNLGGGASVVNPFDHDGDLRVQEFGADYAYSRQRSRTVGSSVGTGHEHFMLSPTSNGSQVFSVPVTYRMEISDSHGPPPAPRTADGSVRLVVPTYRTLEAPFTGPRPAPSTIRDVRASDTRRLALPGAGHTHHEGVLRLPDTALLDRVPGSEELRGLVPRMLDEIGREAARQEEEEARRNRPPMPGAFPEDIDLEAQSGGQDDATEAETPAGKPHPHTRGVPAPTVAGAPGASDVPEPAPRGVVGDLFADAAQWVSGQASGLGRWLWRTAVGEPATHPESMAREVIDTAFSPQHMAANALRVFRDSYVVESIGTPGLVAGTDVVVEVEGYLTNVEVLPEGPAMEAERWLQSVDASASTETATSAQQGTFSLAGWYGTNRSAVSPVGDYTVRRSTSDSVTVNDNTSIFRVTIEDTTPVYRFTAKAHLVVTVRRGRRNVVSGTFAPHPGLSSTKVVEPTQSLEFLLVDNDLQNHPELARLVRTAGRQPTAAKPQDQLLPPWFVASGGTIGFGAVTEVHLSGRRKAFADRIRNLVEREAPGVTRPGYATYVPGVLTRINEHATSLGLRALINAGPRSHTAFHFVHRSWLGPRMVEVALVARPARNAELPDRRGRLVTTTSGLDNVFGHSHGDGAALKVPGATRVSRAKGNSHELSFSTAFPHANHRARPAVGLARRTTWTNAQLSSRELRSWQRTLGHTSEFHVPYEYVVTIRSWTLDDALTGRLLQAISDGFGALTAGVVSLATDTVKHLPNPSAGVRDSEPADVVLRFNASETTGESRALTSGPRLFTSDPTVPPASPPSPGDAVVDVEVPPEIHTVLAGPTWVPARPFQVYDFAGADRLGEALRAVDPSLTRDLTPRTTRSAEGMFIRLTSLAAAGRLTLLEPAAVAPYFGRPGSRGTFVRFTLYSSRIERSSKDSAIDRIELSADGFQTQADNTIATSVTFEHTAGGTHRGGASVPVAGEHASLGQNALTSSQRRELLRFGTPMANDKGEGLDGHRVRAVALLEVRGPRGTRWVTGDILFRTTETPPGAEPSDRTGQTEQPEETGQTHRTDQTEQVQQTAQQPHEAEQQAPSETDAEPGPVTFVTDRPVPRYGGGHRLLTQFQWAQLDSRRLTPRDVHGDGDCFFRALLEIAGDELRQRTGATARTGVNELIVRMRAQTAEELTAHPDRYADHIGGDARDTSVQRLAADIRKRGNFANLAGDVTPWLAAERFGLRLTFVEPDGWISVMGPEGGTPVTLVHLTDGPLHFLAAVPAPVPDATSASAPGPLPVSSPVPGPSLSQMVFEVLSGTAAAENTDTDDLRAGPHPAEGGSPGR